MVKTLIKLFSILALVFISYSIQAQERSETVYDRVMQTKTIRCGYINYAPHFIIDPNTGKKSGIVYDLMEEIGRLLELKIEWTEELGWATTVTAIQSDRVDAICTAFWQNPVEGKFLGFTMPFYYSTMGVYARADDLRFDGKIDTINDPTIKIAAADGSMAMFIAQQDYPKAFVASLPNMTDETQLLMQITTGKADVTFVETYLADKFNQKNGVQLKNIAPQAPPRIFGNTIAIPNDDIRFQNMLNSALVQIIYGGTLEKIIKKYEEVPGGIYRVSRPYQLPQ